MRRKYILGMSAGLIIVILAVTVTLVLALPRNSDDKFGVDLATNSFTLNGEPFRYVGGAFHYWRAHPNTWQFKLQNMRAAGLNVLDTYIYWALHNPHDGEYNFDGFADVEHFLDLAQQEGFYIILRPSPYICAEVDNGGLPHWLFKKYPNIEVRTSNSDYMHEVTEWLRVLMPKFQKYLLSQGGKIIMVQIENEYGIYPGPKGCDTEYLEFLRDETLKYVDDSVLLFTTDIPNSTVACGTVDGVYATIDFSPARGDLELAELTNTMRSIQEQGPLVNSEYYPGWLTHWQEENQVVDGDLVAKVLRQMLDEGWNVNFYMFFGGTNFGFTAGANDWGIGSYKGDITSYDYDAPMTEAGDPTDKFHKIADVIKDFIPSESIGGALVKRKRAIEKMKLEPIDTILSTTGRLHLASAPIHNVRPLTFEELDQFSGLVLYETDLPALDFDPTLLTVKQAHDRAWVFIDEQFVGILSRENNIDEIAIQRGWGTKLQILVENQGRVNFNYLYDKKGILGDVYITKYDGSHENINDWDSLGYSFEKSANIDALIAARGSDRVDVGKRGLLHEGPTIFYKEFELTGDILDTYLDVSGWGKGHVWINGFNLGRYWPIVGPQVTLYVPGDLLNSGTNKIVVVEYQRAHPDWTIEFVDAAKWI